MAGFGFNEAQEMFRVQTRAFARKELAPGAVARARQHKLPRDLVARLGEMGLLGITVPPEHGGMGSDWVSFGIGLEELSRADMFSGFYMMMPGVIYQCLRGADRDIFEQWIPDFVSGKKIVAFAITEPDAGSDATAITMRATRDGDHYVLNGEKTSISLGHEADAAVIFARTGPQPRSKGITCFLVPLTLPGITRRLIPHSGWKPVGAASIIFDDVRIPVSFRAGEEGKGFHTFAGSGADLLRPSLSMMALGLAQTSIEEAIAHSSQRHAFDRPIAAFQGVSFKIAEHVTRLEAARLLCYRTFYLHDMEQPHSRESAMCKWWCPVVAFDAIHDALLIHGHPGYSEESPLEQRLRDLIGFEFADGTAQIMKLIIARDLMGRIV